MNNEYYVYLHRRATDNKVFYVGKGKGKRAYSKNCRNKYWKNTADKHGTIVQIVYDGLSEQCAFDLEIDTIKEMKYHFEDTLTNCTDGGEGISGFRYKFSENQLIKRKDFIYENFSDKTSYRFLEIGNDLIHNTTRLDLCEKFGLKPDTLNSLFKRTNKTIERSGFVLLNDDENNFQDFLNNLNSRNRKRIFNKYAKQCFVFPDGTCIWALKTDIEGKLKVKLNDLVDGKCNVSFGISVIRDSYSGAMDAVSGNTSYSSRFDDNIFTLSNTVTGEVFKGSRLKFAEHIGLDSTRNLTHLFNSKNSRTYKNWILVKEQNE